MRVHANGSAYFEGQFAPASNGTGTRAHGLGVRREVLDTALLSAARTAGARVVEGALVQDLLRAPTGAVEGVVVREADARREIRSRHVVGADGLRSIVARRLGLARRSAWPARYAFVTHCEGIDCAPRGEMHAFVDGYVGIAPVGGGVTNVAVVVPGRRALDAIGDAEGFFSEWIEAHPTVAARVANARRVGELMVTGPFASRAARTAGR